MASSGARSTAGWVDLYWLPLGADDVTHCVRMNGRLFEAVAARRQHRAPNDLYHAGLEVGLGGDRYVIEMAPAWRRSAVDRGVVAEGPVGLAWLGRSRWFRYEVRRWRGGEIPDIASAVDSPQSLSADPHAARSLLDLVPDVPVLTWGRDDLGAGDMWNSNSVVSWLLAGSGHDLSVVRLPAGGRAPGWSAGLAAAARPRPGRSPDAPA